MTAWPPLWRMLRAAALHARGYTADVALGATAPRRAKHERRLALAYAAWRERLPLPAPLSPPPWVAVYNACRREGMSSARLSAMVTVANGVFDAAGLAPLSSDRALAAVRAATRSSATGVRRVHVAFDYLPFLRAVAAAFPPLPASSPAGSLRDRAVALLGSSTLLRPSDMGKLVFPAPRHISPSSCTLFVCFGKGERLKRAAQGKTLSDPFTFACTGLAACPHCALADYCRATAHLDRPTPPIAESAPALPPGAPPLRLLFVSHGSGAPAAVGAQTLTRPLRGVVAGMGVPGATVYSLRGMVASTAHSLGAPLDQVLWWGGWNARTFHAHYNVAGPLLVRPAPGAPPVPLYEFPRAVWRLALSGSS